MVAFNQYSLCRDAEAYYFNLLMEVEQGAIPPNIADHIRECRHCCSRVEQLRNILANRPSNCEASRANASIDTVLKLHFAYLGHPVNCKTVKPFIPTLLDPMLEVRIPTPITVHLDHCQSCSEDLEKIRELNLSRTQLFELSRMLADKTKDSCINSPSVQTTASEIADRPESGVVTVCNTTQSQDAAALSDSHYEGLYSGFPIRVEVSGLQDVAAKKEPTAQKIFTTSETRNGSIKRFAPWVKFGGIAAAVAIAAMLFLFTIPVTKAVTLAQISAAVIKVKNVYIAHFVPGKTEPIQKKWVSRTQELYIITGKSEVAIWDLQKGVLGVYKRTTGETTQRSLSAEEITEMEPLVNSSLGLVPFEDMSAGPEGSQWQRVADAEIPADMSGIEAYDLLWTQQNGSVGNRWRVYVNQQTRLPLKTEFYRIYPGEQEYVLETVMIVEYPTDDEIQKVIRESSF
jgi:hypothetical protein